MPVSETPPGADAWYLFMPLEKLTCPAIDKKWVERGNAERRQKPRSCGRSFFMLGPGTIGRVREASGNQTTWVTPGGVFFCVKCGASLEIQLLPVGLLLPALREVLQIANVLKQLADPLPPVLEQAVGTIAGRQVVLPLPLPLAPEGGAEAREEKTEP